MRISFCSVFNAGLQFNFGGSVATEYNHKKILFNFAAVCRHGIP